METIRLTMAQALVKFLDQQFVSLDGQEHKFVEGIMGIFGHGNVTGIGEALEQDPGELTFIQGKNEQGMVHAATAYAKQKNRLGIYACTSSIGPGALNMATAAATATVNRIPVLLLPGDIFVDRQPDPVLQQMEVPSDYTISANDAFKPLSRYWDRISRPEQLMSACTQAMRVLTDPVETGAVTLCLPQDVQSEAYDYPVSFFQRRVHYIERRPVAASALQRAVQLIKRKRKPLIIAGGGVHYALATEELKRFAERFQIPVVETQAGKSALPWDHPLNMGGVGVTGSLAGNRLAQEADLIITVGTRLADFPTGSKSMFQHPNIELLNINISSFDAIKMNGHQLVGDAREALNALQSELQDGEETYYEPSRLQQLKKEWDQEVDRLYAIERTDGLAQTTVVGAVNETIDERDVIVCAAGSLPGDLHRLWRSKQPKTYHMEYGFSCMGYEVSGAFGVKLAEPDREVYAIVGDGSFLMLHSELLTSVQERKKMNVILLDNNGFQCIHNLQRAHGSNGFGNEFRYRDNSTGKLNGEHVQVDFAGYARSLGVTVFTAGSIDELKEAIQAARKEEGSTLIEVKVLAGTNTEGYDSWWRVDTAAVSKSGSVKQAYEANQEQLARIKPY
ncbi:3D-(3,5/4)-trihydroxycyclohexane-1,2-dione acylhydrolase (decyclizing) [Paenibacillus chungangensis]|uniref:3D-(3,5/4)-trihydroxycyclohexane-1,2-dione acylhydrolase (Decyclizing) n=1 Tax=Paenibacillus chungangensis TaxID=696535 RepID=A0ABW3HL50_9BACL